MLRHIMLYYYFISRLSNGVDGSALKILVEKARIASGVRLYYFVFRR